MDAAGVQPAPVLVDELRVGHARRMQRHAGLAEHDELLVGGLLQRRVQQAARGQDELEGAPGDLRAHVAQGGCQCMRWHCQEPHHLACRIVAPSAFRWGAVVCAWAALQFLLHTCPVHKIRCFTFRKGERHMMRIVGRAAWVPRDAKQSFNAALPPALGSDNTRWLHSTRSAQTVAS